jgi:type IV pilus assembly protein PilC
MSSFHYKAVDANNKIVEGTVQSLNSNTTREVLNKQNLRPISIKSTSSKFSALSKLLGTRVKPKDLVVFTRQLSTMVSAGVPLPRSLNTLQNQTENKKLKEIIKKLNKSIEGGSTYAEALSSYPNIFSSVYINMVRAGEAAGILDEILDKLALQQEKDATIKRKFKSAMTYPTVLICITILVFIGLMTFVIPNLAKIITELSTDNSQIPFLTRTMLAVSDFMTTYWYLLLGAIFTIVYFLRKYLKTPSGRLKRDQVVLKTPVIKVVITKIAVARFARTFASLMIAGVSVLESLDITSKAIGNKVLEKELEKAAADIATGKTLSSSLSKSLVFPPIVPQMLAIGEETGKIDTILIKVADFYEEEVDATLDSLGSIIEPLMIVVMGGMVGLIAASVMGPISNLTNQIS